MKQALLSSAAAIPIAVGATLGVGRYLSPPSGRAEDAVEHAKSIAGREARKERLSC